MEVITHAALGALIGELALGQKMGYRAAIWGAVAGLLPELEYLIRPIYGEFTFLLERRGLLHSVWGLIFIPVLLSILARGWSRSRFPDLRKRDWWKVFAWIWVFHLGLDASTTLGIQFFYPFWKYRVSLNMIASFDVLLTLILILFLSLSLRLPSHHRRRSLWSGIGLTLFGLYMIVAFTNRQTVRSVFANSCQEAGHRPLRYEVYPIWGSNLYWYGIGEEGYSYQVGYYSLLNGLDGRFLLQYLPKEHSLPPYGFFHYLEDRMQEATHRYYNVETRGDTLIWYDLRWGWRQVSDSAEKEPWVSYRLLLKEGQPPTWISQEGPPFFWEEHRGER